MSALISSLERAVNNYRGGRNTLLAYLKIPKSDEVFRKELEASPHHKLGAQTALASAVACCQLKTPHCYDYAVHVAEECGGKFVLVDDSPSFSRSPVEKIGCLVREASDVTSVVLDAMNDGVISDNELEMIEEEVAQAQEALRKLLQAARAVNAAGKPGGRSLIDMPAREMA